MNMKILTVILFLVTFAVSPSFGQQPLIFDFEDGLDGWGVPSWASEKDDSAARGISVSEVVSKEGDKSLELMCDFPGDVWNQAVVELDKDVNLAGYKEITANVYLPKETKGGFYYAKIIVTAGDHYFYIETKNSYALKPGKWTKISANLNVNERNELSQWKCSTRETCILAHLDNVRRISVRIEYDANKAQAGKPYQGPIYIDSIKIT